MSDLEGVTVEWASPPRNASAVSSTTSSGYALVGGLRAACCLTRVAPVLVLAGTDSRHYVDVADDVYRYAPMLATLDDARRAHGVDERMTLENYERMIRFYVALMQAGAAPD
ncbi:MAG: hypothetical protein R3C16_02280 [Hyphomonadaceae bacterium]